MTGVRYESDITADVQKKRMINTIQERQNTEPELHVQQTYKYSSGPTDQDTSPCFECLKTLMLNQSLAPQISYLIHAAFMSKAQG